MYVKGAIHQIDENSVGGVEVLDIFSPGRVASSTFSIKDAYTRFCC